MKFLRLFCLLLLVANASWAQPERYVLVNGVIHSGTTEAFRGNVVVNGTQVEMVNVSQPPPAGLPVVDLKGQHLYPALIDADSCLGMVGVESLRATRDFSEVGSMNPNLVAQHAFRAESDLVEVARSQGILYSGVNPRDRLVSGQGSVMKLWGWTWQDMTLNPSWSLALTWPRVGLSSSLKPKARKAAKERNGKSLFELDEAFAEAKSYRPEEGADVKWGALLPFARGERPLLIRASGESQIRSALDWTAKTGTKAILVAGRDVELFAEELSQRQIPVVYTSVFNDIPSERESYDQYYRVPALLQKAGVMVALSPGGLAFDARELRDMAGRIRAFGFGELRALHTITLHPAKILGLDHKLGTIEPGKDASFVLCEGNILEVAPRVTRAWGEGREISLDDHQKRLYRKYRGRLRELRGQRD